MNDKNGGENRIIHEGKKSQNRIDRIEIIQ
jgi:hypothetical protein